MEHPHEGHEAPPSFWTTRYAIGLLVIGGVAAYFLLRACPRFCVNGLMAGNCRDLQRKRNDRKQRIDRPPVGGLQKA